MTSLLAPIIGEKSTSISKDSNHNIQYQYHRNVLKSKENIIYRPKCKKVLKRKLKKYKLRQDGKEDQDIIDVSDILVSSLFIRSPNKVKDSSELELDALKPKNYLFRMVRRKQTTLKTAKTSKSPGNGKITLIENEVSLPSPATVCDSEEKKQTNAFKLLMNSRSKSLGRNSPGKEISNDETETRECIEKKKIKAKRNLMLQKMAEEKGSLKKAEIEEQHEKYIKKKMEKRAEKLKSMIMTIEPKAVKTDKLKQKSSKKMPLESMKISSGDSIEMDKNRTIAERPIKMLQLVSIFNDNADKKVSIERKDITIEDEEFLKKLSPSLRKKQSMLSYFKKIEKDFDSSPDVSEQQENIIKVKLGSHINKRGRKKKLSLSKESSGSNDLDQIKTIEPDAKAMVNEVIEIQECNDKKRRKRKRVAKESTPCSEIVLTNSSCSSHTDDSRPKRTVKKPVKYNDEITVTSSDDDLNIFTPKKKKHSDHKNNLALELNGSEKINSIKSDTKTIKKTSMNKTDKMLKKPTKNTNLPTPVKLAPIFTKSQPDPTIEAKLKFLQSGVPEQLKKLMSKQKDSNCLSDDFPIVVHVQQLNVTFSESPELNLSEEICMKNIIQTNLNVAFPNVLDLSISQSQICMPIKNTANTQTILQNLKETYPKFPVYRTYKLLKGKKKGEFKDCNFFTNLDNSIEILNGSIDMQNENPDQLTWSDKYKPLSGIEIIGNFENIKELKKWLVTWTENDTKSKSTNSNDSDSSDYYQSELDSRDSMKSNNNLLVLSGPVGSGKTSSVYAVAAELSMKVIEVNSSSKRTGKIMLQDLQEATQSHKVNRSTGSNENSQKSQEIIELIPQVKARKRGRPKKQIEQVTPQKLTKKEKSDLLNGPPASQESARTAMSLILIDDADIVFDQDDGFCSAIMQLVQSSKRPVILITGSLSLPHLQRFLQSSKILKMQPLLPNMLGTWLDLMCLVDSGTCWPGLGAKFLNFFKGDMRKTINCLQFYVGSQDQVLDMDRNQIDSQSSDVMKFNVDDENSCMSWADPDSLQDKNTINMCDTESQSFWKSFLNEHVHLKYMKYPLKMFNVWWSIPKILNKEPKLDSKRKTDYDENANADMKSLESIGNVLDSISACDYFNHISPETEANLTSHPWYTSECDSASELESFDYYDRKYETHNEICCELVKGSIFTAQENMKLEKRFDLDFPGMTVKRQRDRIVSRHTNLVSYLSPHSSLDRKALALDYWSSCRAICRIEKSKTDSNSKRNNRFCHYLKSLSVLCNSNSFDSLANSLNPST